MCNALRLKIPFLILIKNAIIFYQYPNYIAIDINEWSSPENLIICSRNFETILA